MSSPYLGLGSVAHEGLASILLVEDEPELNKAVARVLRTTGFAVATASNNTEALALVEQQAPDLVLSDINRSGGTGIDLILALRKRWTERELPVIFMTGAPSRQTAEQALAAGAYHYLVKPVSPEQLLRIIYKALRRENDPVVSLVRAGTEEAGVDFKRELDLTSKRHRAELARDMIAMANSGGGTIVVGVAEGRRGFEPRGISNAQDLDPTKVGDAVRAYTGSIVKFTSRPVSVDGMIHVAISVQSAEGTIALPQKSNQEAGLFTGRIYIRTLDARTTELTDSNQLGELLERVIEQRQQRLGAIFKSR